MRHPRLLLLLVAAAAVSVPARAGDFELSGNIEAQVRSFWNDPAWVGQDGRAIQGSVALTADVRWRSSDGAQRVSLIPYLRGDAADDERSLADLKEAYWALEGKNYEVLIGANTVFWGVTESVHLVDIVNQTDLAADIDGEDKLGQPMVAVSMQREWGEISAYVMPYFRERTFAGIDGRFRPELPLNTDRPVYESSAKENHVDLALRYSHYFGDVDVGISAFSGTSREPRILPADNANNGQTLLPVYDQISQVGVDLQYTADAWLWKLEAIARDGATHSFAAAVGGFEYTMFQVRESSADLGLLLEYQYDGRNEFEPFTIADNDVFVAARLAINDSQDTAVLAGFSYDTETGETFANIEAERRFGEDWFGELRLRAFGGADPGDTTYWLRKDNYVQLNLARYF